jgi:hypothetical protein
MPFKSVLRGLQRLKSRRDWRQAADELIAERSAAHRLNGPDPYGTGGPLDGATKWWQTPPMRRYQSPVWPPHDDPYAKPEPCDVVQDPALERVQAMAMSDAAVAHMLSLGFRWRDGAWRQPSGAPID